MQVSAKVRYVRISPRKVRAVAELVRGKKAIAAEHELKFMPHKSANIIRRLIHSAVANAEQKGEIDTDNLLIKTIAVDQGPTMNHFMPRSMGRANAILKRISHISLTLEEK